MTDILLLAFVFLLAGVIAVPIATRLGLGSVLGYLIAGIAIGPLLSVLGVDVVSVQHFAEFGVVMMLFLVGLELEPKVLWAMRSKLLGLGGGQVGITTALITGVAMLLGQPWSIALAIGLTLALSSTAIVLQTLNEKGLLKSDAGQSSFSVLLFQDIAVIPMLALIPLLAIPELQSAAGAAGEVSDHGSHMSLVDGLNGWQTALVTLGAIASVIIGGTYLTRPIFRFIAMAQLRELFTAAALMLVVGIALLMSLVGLSPALGTFLAGVVLANSEYRHELEADIDPFRGLLLGLFFITVGAGINFALLSDSLAITLGLTFGLLALKASVLLVLGRVFGLRGAPVWLLALGLAQAGEFGFVLLSFTVANSVIPTDIAEQLSLVIALSMLLTPCLFIFYDKVIAARYCTGQDADADEIDEASQIIIAGRGRVGGIVARMLTAAGHKPTVIDYSSAQLTNLRKFGIHAYFGDATRPDLLHAAGIGEAKLLVVTLDDKEQINKLVNYAIKTYPKLHVLARAVDREHVYHLYAAGCRDIVRETYDSSIRIGRSAFAALGVPNDKAVRMASAFDQMDRKSMLALADSYDINIPAADNPVYVARVREVIGPWEEELSKQLAEIVSEPDSKG